MLQLALGGDSDGSEDSAVDIGLPGGLRGMLTPAYLTAGQFAPATPGPSTTAAAARRTGGVPMESVQGAGTSTTSSGSDRWVRGA
jgi:hypothetical protein